MLFKTTIAFQKLLDYTKAADGSWTAECSGRMHVRVSDVSLEHCRHLALDELDTKLAAWLTASATGDKNRRRMARRVLKRAHRPKTAARQKRGITKSR